MLVKKCYLPLAVIVVEFVELVFRGHLCEKQQSFDHQVLPVLRLEQVLQRVLSGLAEGHETGQHERELRLEVADEPGEDERVLVRQVVEVVLVHVDIQLQHLCLIKLRWLCSCRSTYRALRYDC